MVRESLQSIYNNQTSILGAFTAKLVETQDKVSDVKRLIDGLQASAMARRKQDRNFLKDLDEVTKYMVNTLTPRIIEYNTKHQGSYQVISYIRLSPCIHAGWSHM